MARTFARTIALALLLTGLALPTLAQARPGPQWSDLNDRDRQVLAPLKDDWSSFPDTQRKRLRAVARQYDKMTPQQQQRVQRRMQEWAKLSPEERIQARASFFRLLWAQPPEKKQEIRKKWEEYQKLPPEERERLKEERQSRKAAPSQSPAPQP